MAAEFCARTGDNVRNLAFLRVAGAYGQLARTVRSETTKEAIHVKRFAMQLVEDDRGQDLIEYGLLAGFISLASVTMILNVGSGVEGIYDDLETQAQVLNN